MTRPKDQQTPEMGPAMAKLPNDKWRNFVLNIVAQPGHGCLVRSYLAAGFAKNSPRINARKDAAALARDTRILEAIAEESRKAIRLGAPQAVKALLKMVGNSSHRSHERAVTALLDRVDPVETRSTHMVDVHHHDMSSAAMIKRIRELATTLGIDAEKLLGGNNDALTEAKRMLEGPVIEAEIVDEKRPD